ncbi:methionine adenosyltransferase [Synechococcus sp. Minos11]|jgi:S-adenosylmethionine synthetase|uniref:S-adenosylmethionine synthase n=1 Tax=Synechococcus sp. (strain RCC307) TaxID=316278 RepID=METK_SYNR3|nr:methionine adenosyltransferase [Synechococcus sp. Minos11]A5GR07.1 RecName: Full=S-adenosylmethionine synthase; Short=AdoMet synthase; AltName: Full=MAT; AltName: Full=Methionine adenosyltransferase [Synechococcus sp. RCC307]QNJ07925.1 methionine adenosyltransferase [Synechococcus sp. Minos11]RCL61555.1 MAG: methionine adenosyltransferase [Synechococcus sp. MED-G67]CAK27316.1 S-adenosylmethionine synthetase [Synechococcus sp. RCC307]
MSRYVFTSESVTEGHPDKICDQVSDAVLDALLAQDPASRVACETVVNTGLCIITGEVTTTARVDFNTLVRGVIADIGYSSAKAGGFDANSCAVLVALDQQSPDIAQGVDEADDHAGDPLDKVGAGDQGIMFGYACDETPELMPLPISLAHRLARRLAEVRHNGTLGYLLPDGKTQVSVVYEDDQPVAIDTILISTQHIAEIDGISDEKGLRERISADLWTHVVEPATADLSLKPSKDTTKYLVNPTGKFVVGGPQGDAGLTGRKIIVDTYGGYARHGGGAFSGKDPTKVDRSAAYAARFVAKALVAAGLARKAEVQLSYAIGVAKPVSILVESFGTSSHSNDELTELVNANFDLRPGAIIENFKLRNLPQQRGGNFYREVAAYGHFGRSDLNLPWEDVSVIAAKLKG